MVGKTVGGREGFSGGLTETLFVQRSSLRPSHIRPWYTFRRPFAETPRSEIAGHFAALERDEVALEAAPRLQIPLLTIHLRPGLYPSAAKTRFSCLISTALLSHSSRHSLPFPSSILIPLSSPTLHLFNPAIAGSFSAS